MAGAIAMLISSGATAAELHAAEQPEDGQSATGGLPGVHHDHGRGAVGELRGVAGGRGAARVDGLQRREPLEGGVGARALVAIERHLLRVGGLRHLVGDLHGGRERHDLLGELAGRRRRGDALLAAHDVGVLRLAADAVLLRDEVGGLVHRPPHRRHARAAAARRRSRSCSS